MGGDRGHIPTYAVSMVGYHWESFGDVFGAMEIDIYVFIIMGFLFAISRV